MEHESRFLIDISKSISDRKSVRYNEELKKKSEDK